MAYGLLGLRPLFISFGFMSASMPADSNSHPAKWTEPIEALWLRHTIKVM